jgi:lauroyl/myristoyl acyltransferase
MQTAMRGRFRAGVHRMVSAAMQALLRQVVLASPGVGFRALAGIGRGTDTLSCSTDCFSVDELRIVFKEYEPARLRCLAGEIRAAELIDRAMVDLIERRGFSSLQPLIDRVGAERLLERQRRREPTILLSWHLGASWYPIVSGVLALGLHPVWVVQKHARLPLPEDCVVWDVRGNAAAKAVVLRRALRHLREGGMVAISGDGILGESGFETPFLSRSVSLRRGPAVLAARSGAPIIPITATWSRRRRIVVRVHDPLRPSTCDSAEQSMQMAIAGFYEAHLRQRPEDLHADTLREILRPSSGRVEGGPSIGHVGSHQSAGVRQIEGDR